MSNIPPGMDHEIDCFAFRRDDDGKPYCDCLLDLYCMLKGECSFQATPEEAESAKKAVHKKLYGT